MLEILYLSTAVVGGGIVGFYVPWMGRRLLHYRKIPISSTKSFSFLLGVLASFAGGIIAHRIFLLWEIVLALIFFLLLLLIGWIDWHTGYILDQLTIGGSLIIIGLELLWSPSVLPSRLAGCISIFLFMYLLAHWTNRIGHGDAKLLAMCALWMNWENVLIAIWLASISGLVFVFILVLRKKIEMRSYALPFGPHLAFGAFSSYLFGEQVIHLFSDEFVLSTLLVHIL